MLPPRKTQLSFCSTYGLNTSEKFATCNPCNRKIVKHTYLSIWAYKKRIDLLIVLQI